MKMYFEEIVKRLSPTLRRITYKLNGHFSFFDDDDLFQEALEHLWIAFQEGKLSDKTDSYILQGCYFHLKNYLRKTIDKASLTSLNELIDEEGGSLEYLLISKNESFPDDLNTTLLVEAAKTNGLTEKETEVLSLALDDFTVREIGSRLGISHVMVIKLKRKIQNKCETMKNKYKNGYQN